MNAVALVGRLTKDVECRLTSTGVIYGRFTLAVNRRRTNQRGERETDFISCVVWKKAAEVLQKYTCKGERIGVKGSIRTNSYINKQGIKIYTTDVLVENIDLLERRKNSVSDEPMMLPQPDIAFNEEDLPF